MKKNDLQALLLLMLVACAIFLLDNRQLPNTGAEFTTKTVTINNLLKTPVADVSIIEGTNEYEEGDGGRYLLNAQAEIAKKVAIKNKGDVSLAIRLMIILQLRDYNDNILIGAYDQEIGNPFLDLSFDRIVDKDSTLLDYQWKKVGDYFYLVKKDYPNELFELKPPNEAAFMEGLKIRRMEEFIWGDGIEGEDGKVEHPWRKEPRLFVTIGEQNYYFDELHFSIQVVVDSLRYTDNPAGNGWRWTE